MFSLPDDLSTDRLESKKGPALHQQWLYCLLATSAGVRGVSLN